MSTEIQASIIQIMVTMAAVDGSMSDSELDRMSAIVKQWPVFSGFDPSDIRSIADRSLTILQDEDGLDVLMASAKIDLPQKLFETAYAAACDVAAADGVVSQEEAQMLEMIRHGLNLDRLIAAGIERGIRARYTSI